MIHGQLELDKDTRLGKYTVIAAIPGVSGAKAEVKVRRYQLPPYFVTIELDKGQRAAPGATLRGAVVARYPHGAPVKGEVGVQAVSNAGSYDELELELDSRGRAPFAIALAEEADWLEIAAAVQDGAARLQRTKLEVDLPSRHLDIRVIPERKRLIPRSPAVGHDPHHQSPGHAGRDAPRDRCGWAQPYLRIPGRDSGPDHARGKERPAGFDGRARACGQAQRNLGQQPRRRAGSGPLDTAGSSCRRRRRCHRSIGPMADKRAAGTAGAHLVARRIAGRPGHRQG